jgi:hypothetical protein
MTFSFLGFSAGFALFSSTFTLSLGYLTYLTLTLASVAVLLLSITTTFSYFFSCFFASGFLVLSFTSTFSYLFSCFLTSAFYVLGEEIFFLG